ncbi:MULTISPECIES: peptidylprolyl isomerase [unclassified Fibrobacter]|uniref:FKBP-type peptidyl-prolyl cis-trans isomerase n=1 Tax=unclassified Fibrobacter TaxID=2634177 RepID=UPI000D6C8515|nr:MULTISPECIES: FKBP-type peptidyl-prolyl cis-trans isomerase [unclassified Fibrobacter]PWJ61131.1 FKBP-type peptidyl prolyl cis-trans isomerase /apo-metallochaperone SlyD [Fibrobacter sp. UWR4]PZW65589.1 FKBP-type peptidyl prolyl cis-trans isomerase /apo-metallochaperone SlyD [Fibrobacter sp. UWR1]
MEIIQDKLKVSIAYTLKELSGKILEEVPATHPFVYIHGYNNIIPGLEEALTGHKVNDIFSVEIPTEKGYGPFREDLVIEVPKEELREIGEIWLGMELEMCQDEDIREFQLPESEDEFIEGLNLDSDEDEADGIYTIKEIRKNTVLVDGNHPFAGKDLIFDVQVVAIESPSFTELESGFPDKNEDDFNEFEDEDGQGFGDDFGHNPENYRRWR